jgi:hypothetical protein
MKELAAVLKSLSQLLGANDKSQARRNLRIVKKTYKFIKREFKKGGFSEEETETLNELREALIRKTIKL